MWSAVVDPAWIELPSTPPHERAALMLMVRSD